MRRVLDTAVLAANDRFGFWQEMVSQETMPILVRSRHAANFTATVHTADIGAIRTIAVEHPPLEVERTPALIRRSDPEDYHFVLNLAGRQQIEQDRRGAVLRPGDMTIYHSSRAFRTHTDPVLTRESAIVIQIPQRALPTAVDRLRPVLAVTFPGQGLGLLVSSYLSTLARGVGPLSGDDELRLASVTLDLISVLLAQQLGAPDRLPPETRTNALHAQVRAFVLAQLGDRDLTPEMIAAAHHISVRSLHRLFHLDGTTVSTWIREQRLRRCRRDLLDPPQALRPVASIGRRWGFPDATHFSRAFKAEYGQSPAA